MLLIGSRATRFHYPGARKPQDFDFIATSSEVSKFLSNYDWTDTSSHDKKRRARAHVKGQTVHFEFELVDRYPSSKLIYKYDRSFSKQDDLLELTYHVASPQTLYLLKKSHIVFNIHWQKNIYDYLYLKNKIANLIWPYWASAAFDLRFKEVSDRINKNPMKFDMSNSDFFKKSEAFVHRFVGHDSIHYATCFYDKPLFISAKDDITKAELSEARVARMSRELKIQMIQEESMALALERYIIPAMIKKQSYSAKDAYQKTAAKMVYNYLPMFMRHFAADNFLEILDLNVDYVDKFVNNHPTFTQQLEDSFSKERQD